MGCPLSNLNRLLAGPALLVGFSAGFTSGFTGCVKAGAEPVVSTPDSLNALVAQNEKKAESVPPVSSSGTQTASASSDFVGGSEVIVLKVDKRTLSAELRTWPESGGDSRLLRTFRIAIGKEEGDKQKEGDNKTPEGVYFTEKVLDGSKLPARYGPKAIPIDFPNPIDRFKKKTGYGIWLHGVEADERIEQAKVTEGCVAFYNADILKLTSWLRPRQGVVVIAHDIRQVNQAEDLAAVEARTREWSEAWAARDLPRYMSFFSEDFVHNGKNLSAWHKYKERVFNSYKDMRIKFDHVRVIAHPKYAVSMMNQDFRGDDRFSAIGRKLLYWQKGSDGQWYITREVFKQPVIQLHSFSEAELALLSSTASSISSKQEPSPPNL
jgi:murein L,D-transpeptidase YafK